MKPANPRILTISGGSSSIKFALFEAGDALGRVLGGGVRQSRSDRRLRQRQPHAPALAEYFRDDEHRDVLLLIDNIFRRSSPHPSIF
jgi:acetate kinase